MAYVTNFDQSNKADWVTEISATDADTGDAIDFTGASVAFQVNDDQGCQRLLATTANGKITLPDVNTLQVSFTDEEMKTLCSGSYACGAVYSLNGETNQLLVGTVSIYNGVASL
ncbi:hypothetical protein [Bradyrhizobium sp. 87]|jgi:hypothetical protein|uniref:hypothetical protein n=1 Tax=Bradyrhizobium sp. 87 TaxID=2782682 RepID=UPI001FFA539D|nr:hypothetical protein [Bradyrhizobium sp. 87]MCK1430908.1 hypothetical protein [Bradyrhizobium sp. 87]